ncbi:hypothetical protein PRIPAC_96721 [Pristionchus pacificus]|uniref:Uncharacterized protein n=1 Tax=Pristionchus pacificus TaxID=54126 RepID=A0A454XZR7_PRIPA|nr:hypothetical protein PRIPAC_96721 [Pristionchus pacificus]|eukprot:PDM81762.1 hypothetical protein PRIPAC_37604 [Pristionchus pacificus]
MARFIIVLALLVGAAAAWNYRTGYDSHPWNIKNIWVKRSKQMDLPPPPVRARAPGMSYIHKRSEDTSSESGENTQYAVLPLPIVLDNANMVIYTSGGDLE